MSSTTPFGCAKSRAFLAGLQGMVGHRPVTAPLPSACAGESADGLPELFCCSWSPRKRDAWAGVGSFVRHNNCPFDCEPTPMRPRCPFQGRGGPQALRRARSPTNAVRKRAALTATRAGPALSDRVLDGTAGKFGRTESAKLNRRRTRLNLADGSLSHAPEHLPLFDGVVKRVMGMAR